MLYSVIGGFLDIIFARHQSEICFYLEIITESNDDQAINHMSYISSVPPGHLQKLGIAIQTLRGYANRLFKLNIH